MAAYSVPDVCRRATNFRHRPTVQAKMNAARQEISDVTGSRRRHAARPATWRKLHLCGDDPPASGDEQVPDHYQPEDDCTRQA